MGSVFYEVVADATAVAHLIFILYVVCGGFLAWRWPRTIALHLAAVAWGFTGLLVGIDCPLTHLESWARVRAGQDHSPRPGSSPLPHRGRPTRNPPRERSKLSSRSASSPRGSATSSCGSRTPDTPHTHPPRRYRRLISRFPTAE